MLYIIESNSYKSVSDNLPLLMNEVGYLEDYGDENITIKEVIGYDKGKYITGKTIYPSEKQNELARTKELLQEALLYLYESKLYNDFLKYLDDVGINNITKSEENEYGITIKKARTSDTIIDMFHVIK